MKQSHRIGALTGTLLLLITLVLIAQLGLFAWEIIVANQSVLFGRPRPLSEYFKPAFVGLVVLNVLLMVGARHRLLGVVPGTKGRVRLLFLVRAALAAQIGTLALVLATTRVFESATPIATVIATKAFDIRTFQLTTKEASHAYAYLIAGALGYVTMIACTWATWFLIPDRVRARIWSVVDLALAVAFVYALHAWPASASWDAPDAVAAATKRLAITELFAVRAVARSIPIALDLIERTSFAPLVAARLLRAGKSGFLTMISFLSILAVSVSSCALTTTLSVMGGFRGDLKRKIIGQNAHVVVDREHARLSGWQPVLDRVRQTEGVRGATPYVSGEVMLSSLTNRAGAVLRGIDADTIGTVTELPRTLQSGKLEYLNAPSRLLSDTQREQSKIRSHGTLLRDIDEALRDSAAGAAGAQVGGPDDDARDDGLDDLDRPLTPYGTTVLPAIVLGKELARSLRVYVGDEIDVVSPLGELGPTGPMPKSRPFRVAGIFYSGMYEFDMKFAYVALPTGQEFLSTAGAITGIEIKVHDVDRAPQVAQRIRTALNGTQVRVRDWQDLNKNLFGALALEKIAMFVVLAIAILVASFCIFASLMLMVQEKGRQVGILKALGATSSSIVSVFMLEGLFIGSFGAGIGLGAGYAVCFAAEHIGLPIEADVYYIDRLPVHIDPLEFATVGLTALLMGVIVTIVPAVLASRLNPIDALRYE